jgi:hypothetical protein
VWFMPGTLSKGNVIICECNCWMFNLCLAWSISYS